MTTDKELDALVEHLRRSHDCGRSNGFRCSRCESADAISALRKERDRLRDVALSYKAGRCYPCGWPLHKSVEDGCIPDNCSYRPSERAHDYHQWRERAGFIASLAPQEPTTDAAIKEAGLQAPTPKDET